MTSGHSNLAIRIAVVIIIPFVIYGVFIIFGNDVVNLLRMKDVIYFNWRNIPALICMPWLAFGEVLFISSFFTRNQEIQPTLMKYANYIGLVTSVLFFLALLRGPIINVAFSFSSYHTCSIDGMFSGVYYVKDKSHCEKLTSAVAWE